MREEVEIREKVSTHSRAEAAALALCLRIVTPRVSTHSRAEAAAYFPTSSRLRIFGFQHTAARRRLLPGLAGLLAGKVFQHTAARRRLPSICILVCTNSIVSTHSRAEAAALSQLLKVKDLKFQHTAARRRLQLGFFDPLF